MKTGAELLAEAKARIREVSVAEGMTLHATGGAVFLDVREPNEWNLGRIPGAVFIPRGRFGERRRGARATRVARGRVLRERESFRICRRYAGANGLCRRGIDDPGMEWMGGVRWSGGKLTIPALLDRITRALSVHQPQAAMRDTPLREAAVALVLAPRGKDLDLLLLTRAVHETDPWSGQVALPGGRAEPGDATLLATAIRETREETTLDLSHVAMLGELDELRPRSPMLPPIVVRPYVFAVRAASPLAPSVEVAELFWAPLSKLFDPALSARMEVRPRGLRMTVDAIEFEGRVIWGMTERILRSLQSVVSSVG